MKAYTGATVAHSRLPAVPLQQPRAKRTKAATDEERRRRAVESTTKYRRTPRGRYVTHRRNAQQRGVAFRLTFEQWLQVWQESGRFDERGNKTADGYVMARHEDRGAYEIGNVSIIRHGENVAQRNHYYAKRRYRFTRADMTESWLHVHSAADAD